MEFPFTIKYDKSICHNVMFNIENISIYSLCFSITYASFSMYLNKKYLFVSQQKQISYDKSDIAISYDNDLSLLKPLISIKHVDDYNKLRVFNTTFSLYKFNYVNVNKFYIMSFSPDDHKYLYINNQDIQLYSPNDHKKIYINTKHTGLKEIYDNRIEFFEEPVTYKNYRSTTLNDDKIIYLTSKDREVNKNKPVCINTKYDNKYSVMLNESLSVGTFVKDIYNSKSSYKLLYRNKPEIIKNKIKTVSTNKKGIIKNDYTKSMFKDKPDIIKNDFINIGYTNKNIDIDSNQDLIDVSKPNMFKITNMSVDVGKPNVYKVDSISVDASKPNMFKINSISVDNNNNNTIINNSNKMLETNPSSIDNSVDVIKMNITNKDIISRIDYLSLNNSNKDINDNDFAIKYKQNTRDINTKLSNIDVQKNHVDIINKHELLTLDISNSPINVLNTLNVYKDAVKTNYDDTLIKLYRNIPGLYIKEDILFFDMINRYKSKGVTINNSIFVDNNDRKLLEQESLFVINKNKGMFEQYLLYTDKDSIKVKEDQQVLLKELDKHGIFGDEYKMVSKGDIGTFLSEDIIFDLDGKGIESQKTVIVSKSDAGVNADLRYPLIDKDIIHTHLDYFYPWIDKDIIHTHLDYTYPWIDKYMHDGSLHNRIINVDDNIKNAYLDYNYFYINKNIKNSSLHEYYNSLVSKNTEHFMYVSNIGLDKYNQSVSYDFSMLNLSKQSEGTQYSNNMSIQKDSKGIYLLNNLLIDNDSKGIETYKNVFIDKFNKPIYMLENVFIDKYANGIYEEKALFTDKFTNGVEIQRDTTVSEFDNGIVLNDDITVYEFGRDIHLRDSYLPIEMHIKPGAFNKTVLIKQEKINTDIDKDLTINSDIEHLFYNSSFGADKSINHAKFSNTEEFVNMTRDIGDMRFDNNTMLKKYIKDTNNFVQGDFVTVIHYDGADKPIGLSNKIDELLLPHKDYKYKTLFDKLVYPDGAINYKYVKSYNAETGEYIISIPIENPIDIYADIGRDYIDIDSNILNTVIYMIREIWKDNMFRYIAFSAQDSIKDILIKLDSKIQIHYDGNKAMIIQCMRCMQLFRWYAEMAILNNCEYVLKFDTTKAVVDYFNKTLGMFEDIIVFNNMYISDEYIIEPEDTTKTAMITFVRNKKTPGKPFNLSFTLYNINTSSSISIIDDDGTKSLKSYEPGIHQIQLELKNQITVRFIPTGKNQTVNVANISIDNFTLQGFTVSYNGRFGETNAVLQDLLDRLFVVGEASAELKSQLQNVVPATVAIDTIIKYFELHHENKSKGKRLTIKK